MKTTLGILLLTLCSWTTSAIAAEGNRTIGNVDLRPSWTTKAGSLATEDSAEVGYKISDKVSASYVQEFGTNLYNPNTEGDQGLSLLIGRGFLRSKVGPIWSNEEQGLSLRHQARVYLPISAADRDAGFISIIRNYATLTKKFSPTVSVSLSELPIVALYSRSGNVAADGSKSATPHFENRVYLITDIQITEALSLSLPVMFHQTRYSNFDADAANNDSWRFFLWVYPELTYSVTPNFAVAAAYYSDNLVSSDLKYVPMGAGLEKGVFQVSLQASL